MRNEESRLTATTRILNVNEDEVRKNLAKSQPDVERFKAALLSGDESETIRLMDLYIAQYGEVAFRWATSGMECQVGQDKIDVQANAFIIASYKGMLTVAEKLLDEKYWPYDPDIYLHSTSVSMTAALDNLTPLMIACINNNLQLAEFLVRHGVRLACVRDETKSEILGARRRGWDGVVDYLIQHADVLSDQQINTHLDLLRTLYFSTPGLNKKIDEDCEKLRTKLTIAKSSWLPPDIILRDAALYDSYKNISGSGAAPEKADALTRVNRQLEQLLKHPVTCCKYLKFLNDEFARYHLYVTGENITPPDQAQFSFKAIGKTWYPIPTINYHGTKKHGTLKEYLLALFREHGIGSRAVKWLGFIPQEAADAMVGSGDFISESAYGATGLLHGKLSHMIQTAIMIFAIENGDIDIEYNENGRNSRLTMSEILASQGVGRRGKFAGVWDQTRDTRIYDDVSFGDPHRLSSVIMRDGDLFGAKELSHYLIDSFCKDFIKNYHATLKYIPDLGSMDVFADKLNDLAPNSFYVPHYMSDHAMSYYDKKPSFKCKLFHHDEPVAAIAMELKPKDGFKPQSFKI